VYGFGVASSDKMIIPSFQEIGKLVQRLKWTHTQNGDLITLRKKVRRVKNVSERKKK
jgi:hypothetical protein